ncbi:MAG TPA: response regulator transcription factor [Bryobacteraceae bacterium]|jgi:DNA-binding NarL/FixJ family response regulator|nr:response regulator transcription factor [Bryobacteraceae bacterium]
MSETPETRTVRLLLVDGNVLFRESLASLLDAEPGLAVAGQCATAQEAAGLLARSPVDVVLVSFDGWTAAGFATIATVRPAAPDAGILVLAARMEPHDAVRALRSGVCGIFLKDNHAQKLIAAVRMVAGGHAWIDRGLLRALAEGPPGGAAGFGALSDREQRVLRALAEGRTNRRIGEEIGASEAAVKRTLHHLFEKTGTRSRAALVRAALEGSLGER